MIAIHSPGALHLPRVTARWWRPIVLGVLWGVAVSAMESVVLPVYPDAWTGFWKILAWIVPGWCVVGVGLATLIEWVGARFERTSQIVTFMIACALGLSAIYSMLYALAPASGPRSGMSVVFPQGFDPLVALVYQFWVVLFYGGLYFVAWSLRHRSQRSRETLARVEIARIKAETMLAEEQLHRLRGRIEPQLLLRVVTEVERRYLSDGPSADELLGLLVAFLRLAMPAIRSGKSGLGAELSLVEAYDALGANLERRSRQWSISCVPLPDLPFPPMLLLPLVDEVASRAGQPFVGQISVSHESNAVIVRLVGGSIGNNDWISPGLEYRMRVALSTLYGVAWRLRHHSPSAMTSRALDIVLEPRRAPTTTSEVLGSTYAFQTS